MHVTKLLKHNEEDGLSTQSPSSSRQESTLELPRLRKSKEGEYSVARGPTLAQEVLSEEAAVTTLERRAHTSFGVRRPCRI